MVPWAEVERLRIEQLMAKAVGRFLHRIMSGAWERWRDVAIEHREQRKILMKAVARMKSRQLAGAWNRWQEWLVDKKEAEENKRLHTERVIARFLKGTLAKAWRTWHENWQEALRIRNIVKVGSTQGAAFTRMTPLGFRLTACLQVASGGFRLASGWL